MAINKVTYSGNVLLDLSEDTVTENDVAEGKTFHLANGEPSKGTGQMGGKAIIDVDELPTENIRTDVFYRVSSSNVPLFDYKIDIWYNSEKNKINGKDVVVHMCPYLPDPSVAEPFFDAITNTIIFYIDGYRNIFGFDPINNSFDSPASIWSTFFEEPTPDLIPLFSSELADFPFLSWREASEFNADCLLIIFDAQLSIENIKSIEYFGTEYGDESGNLEISVYNNWEWEGNQPNKIILVDKLPDNPVCFTEEVLADETIQHAVFYITPDGRTQRYLLLDLETQECDWDYDVLPIFYTVPATCNSLLDKVAAQELEYAEALVVQGKESKPDLYHYADKWNKITPEPEAQDSDIVDMLASLNMLPAYSDGKNNVLTDENNNVFIY